MSEKPKIHEGLKEGSLSKFADGVMLESARLAGEDGVDRSRIAVDTVVGAIVRHNGMNSFQDVAREAINAEFQHITRNDGLRRTVLQLLGDEELSPDTLHALRRLQETHYTPEGFKLTNLDEIAGFLQYEPPNEADKLSDIERAQTWKEVILSHLEDYVNSPVEEIPSPFDSQHMMAAGSAELGRRLQLEFENAVRIARKTGMDLELLKRSALEARRRRVDGQHIGGHALRVIVTNFDDMFK